MATSDIRTAVRRARLLPAWVLRADVRAAAAVNGRRTHPFADAFWRSVTGFANRGMLWWTAAIVLAITGHRRAAARGVGSLLAASILANLIAKRVFGGDRPILEEVPIARRLPKQPLSPAFPSGHSASAAAFAVGVAAESPRIGAALAPVALGIGYSRMHVGAHWLSDVAGGLAIGAAIAGAGALLVPGRRAAATPSGEDRMLPASPDGEGVFIVVNRDSGTAVVRSDPVRALRDRLPLAEVRVLGDGEDPASVARDAMSRPNPPTILGVCGGDGSVSSVAHVARHAGVPLLVVPGGTFNHFARAAGAASVDLAIDAVQRGEGVRVDVADLAFGDQEPVTVLNTATVGVYPEFVVDREAREERLGKWLAAIVAAGRALRHSEPVGIELGGRRMRVWTMFVGVGPNDPGMTAPIERRRLDGGVLDVRILHAESRARAAASLAVGRRVRGVLETIRLLPRRTESFSAEELDVIVRPQHGQPPGFAHDGEVALDGPAAADERSPGPGYRTTIRLVPQALDVYRPASSRRSQGQRAEFSG